MNIKELLIVTDEEKEAVLKQRTRKPEDFRRDAELLKEWWKKQAHMPKFNESDDYLEKLIQYNKCSLERTKSKFEYFCAAPHFYPNFFKIRDPTDPFIQASMKAFIHVPLPKMTENYSRVTVTQMRENVKEFSLCALITTIFLIADIRLREDRGRYDELIIDMKNWKIGHIAQFNITEIKEAIIVFQRGYSEAIKAVHVVNVPSFAVNLINMLKPLFKEKFFSRVSIYDNSEQLTEIYPKKILPSDFGGDEMSLQELQDEWTKYLISQRDFLMNMENRLTNEKLRTGSSLEDDFLGIQGSFKQITVD